MNKPLLGLWTLKAWDKVFHDGRHKPYCEARVGGFLYYAAEGMMAVSIYERDQDRLLSAYTGRFEFLQGEVVHHPIEGSSPYGIQGKKVRVIRFEQEQMFMETKWTDPNTDGFIHRLVWLKTV